MGLGSRAGGLDAMLPCVGTIHPFESASFFGPVDSHPQKKTANAREAPRVAADRSGQSRFNFIRSRPNAHRDRLAGG